MPRHHRSISADLDDNLAQELLCESVPVSDTSSTETLLAYTKEPKQGLDWPKIVRYQTFIRKVLAQTQARTSCQQKLQQQISSYQQQLEDNLKQMSGL